MKRQFVTPKEKARKRLIRLSNEAAITALTGRVDLLRVKQLLEARSREIVSAYGDDGVEIYDRIRLTDEDRLSNLRAARVWHAKAGNELRHLEAQLDKAIEIAERAIDG